MVVTQVSLKLARESVGDIGIASEKFQRNYEEFIFVGVFAAVPVVFGGGPLSTDLSLCLLHGSDSGQPFLCGPQYSGEC